MSGRHSGTLDHSRDKCCGFLPWGTAVCPDVHRKAASVSIGGMGGDPLFKGPIPEESETIATVSPYFNALGLIIKSSLNQIVLTAVYHIAILYIKVS